MQNFIINRIHFDTFEGEGISKEGGGGGLSIGCIFCSLVDGPLPGETYK